VKLKYSELWQRNIETEENDLPYGLILLPQSIIYPSNDYPKRSIVTYSVFILVILEWVSGRILKITNPNDMPKYEFNRSLSGYTVFNNSPNFRYWTYKEKDNGVDVQTDENGFICDEKINMKKEPGTIIFINKDRLDILKENINETLIFSKEQYKVPPFILHPEQYAYLKKESDKIKIYILK
jgi:hypothetical protein